MYIFLVSKWIRGSHNIPPVLLLHTLLFIISTYTFNTPVKVTDLRIRYHKVYSKSSVTGYLKRKNGEK